MAEWISVKDRLPERGGRYLCCCKSMLFKNNPPYLDFCGFTSNLSKVDKYDFEGKNRPGWYKYSSEWGYYEETGVTHWMPLPEPPKEG